MVRQIRCWTIQDSTFLDQPGQKLFCKPEFVSSNFRIAYRWMKKAYKKIKRRPIHGYPIWLWEKTPSDSEKKRHEMATSLLAEAEYSKPKVFIDLKIPGELLLPSLYSRWNILLDYSIVFQREPQQFSDWKRVFDISKRKAWDHVQYAAPFIQKQWIEDEQRVVLKQIKGLLGVSARTTT